MGEDGVKTSDIISQDLEITIVPHQKIGFPKMVRNAVFSLRKSSVSPKLVPPEKKNEDAKQPSIAS